MLGLFAFKRRRYSFNPVDPGLAGWRSGSRAVRVFTMWFLYPASRDPALPDLRARARQRERDREKSRDLPRQRDPYPGDPLVAQSPALDPPTDSRIRVLGDDRTQHLGRRGDRRSDERITRDDREKAVLWMLGVFRVATRRSLVESCFDGHPFVANRVLAELEKKKLIRKREVKRGKRGYQVYTLQGQGRDQLALERLRLDQDESTAGPQRYWSDAGDSRQLRHDHHVFDAVCRDSRDVLDSGGRVVRVRLESELRGRLAAAETGGRTVGGAEGARKARMAEARGLGPYIAAGGRFCCSLQAPFLPVAGRLHPGSFSAGPGFPGPVGVLFRVCV